MTLTLKELFVVVAASSAVYLILLGFARLIERRAATSPISYLTVELWKKFKWSILSISLGSTAVIALGFSAGVSRYNALFTAIIALTVAGIAFYFWLSWPRDLHQGNLFDFLPIEKPKWPLIDDEEYREFRTWLDDRAKELKSNPPEFTKENFAAVALEIVEKAQSAAQKKTPLSLSLEVLSSGLQKTAEDLKLLLNQLPLVGKFTLAAIERELEYALKYGRTFYLAFFALLSAVNPGNLVRVILGLTMRQSPWKHVISELRGWVFMHYAQRLGYHLYLLYSEIPPPKIDPDKVTEKPEKNGADVQANRWKIIALSAVSFGGGTLYLSLQIVYSQLLFGPAALAINLPALLFIASGIAQLRSPQRWREFWNALLPQWPQSEPPLSERDLAAQKAMQAVLYRYKNPPPISTDNIGELPKYYGDILLELWDECAKSYSGQSDPRKARMELLLPQAAAGVEDLFRAFRDWLNSESAVASLLKILESLGLNLEKLYLYLMEKNRQRPQPGEYVDLYSVPGDAHTTSPERQLPPPRENRERDNESTDKPEDNGKVADTEPSASPPANALEQFLGEGLASLGEKLGQFIVKSAKEFAVNLFHQKALELIEEEYCSRLLDIYGARYTADRFEKADRIHPSRALIIARDDRYIRPLLEKLGYPQSERAGADSLPRTIPPTPELPELDTLLYSPDNPTSKALAERLLSLREYSAVILVEEIDYGAKERVANWLQTELNPLLREYQPHRPDLLLVLAGVEKLPPLRWDPPYDDYLSQSPQKKKSQRIRSAAEAWRTSLRPLNIPPELIFPVGIPSQGESWGVQKLKRILALYRENREK